MGTWHCMGMGCGADRTDSTLGSSSSSGRAENLTLTKSLDWWSRQFWSWEVFQSCRNLQHHWEDYSPQKKHILGCTHICTPVYNHVYTEPIHTHTHIQAHTHTHTHTHFMVGRLLRWPPRVPPSGVHTLHNLLPLSMGGTCEYDGYHPHD